LLQRINHGGTNTIAVFSLVLFTIYYLRRKTQWNPATPSNASNPVGPVLSRFENKKLFSRYTSGFSDGFFSNISLSGLNLI